MKMELIKTIINYYHRLTYDCPLKPKDNLGIADYECMRIPNCQYKGKSLSITNRWECKLYNKLEEIIKNDIQQGSNRLQ